MNASEARNNFKRVLDSARDGELVSILRGDEIYELRLKSRGSHMSGAVKKFVDTVEDSKQELLKEDLKEWLAARGVLTADTIKAEVLEPCKGHVLWEQDCGLPGCKYQA